MKQHRRPIPSTPANERVRFNFITMNNKAYIIAKEGAYSAEELREAAHLFNQIAEWLEDEATGSNV